MTVRLGVDLANYQHPNGERIDYQRVADAGVSWAAVLLGDAWLTGGRRFVNHFAAEDVSGLRSVGIETLGYVFSRPELGDPVGQAQWARGLEAVDLVDRLALDVETGIPSIGAAAVAGFVGGFLAELACELLYWPLSYRTPLLPRLTRATGWGGLEWVAAPSGLPAGITPAVQQYGQDTIPGISGAVDLNHVFYDRRVPRMFATPLLQCVAACTDPTGKGGYLLGDDGSVYTFGDAPFYGSASGQPFFVGRHGATIALRTDGVDGYVVTDTAGESYTFPIG